MNPLRHLRRLQKYCLLSQRYLLAAMLLFGITANYISKVSVAVALKHMVEPSNVSAKNLANRNCPYDKKPIPFKPASTVKYKWNVQMRHYITRSFSIGYIIGHLPGGVLADKYGGKYVLGFAVVGTSFVGLISSKVMEFSNGHYFGMIIMRFFAGIMMGAMFPAIHSLLSQWAPARDRAKLSCITFAATQFAIFINYMASNAMIVATKDWTSIFFVYGAVGVLWYVFWHLFFFSSPYTNPYVEKRELQYLQKELDGHVTCGPKTIPWIRIATSAPMWALMITQMGHLVLWGIMGKELPRFMNEVLQFNIKDSHMLSSVSYFFMAIETIILGFVSDFLVNNDYLQVTTHRKIFTTFGAMGPSIFMLAAVYSGCQRSVSFATLTFAMSTMSFYYAGTRVNALDLAPNFSGVIMAAANGLGALPVLLVPIIFEKMTSKGSLYQWRHTFWLFFVVFAVTNFVFMIWGSGEEQPWNDPRSWERYLKQRERQRQRRQRQRERLRQLEEDEEEEEEEREEEGREDDDYE